MLLYNILYNEREEDSKNTNKQDFDHMPSTPWMSHLVNTRYCNRYGGARGEAGLGEQ